MKPSCSYLGWYKRRPTDVRVSASRSRELNPGGMASVQIFLLCAESAVLILKHQISVQSNVEISSLPLIEINSRLC